MQKSKYPTSFRLSSKTLRQLIDLAQITGNSRGQVIETAIDRMWIRENEREIPAEKK